MKFKFSVLLFLLFSTINLFAQDDYDRPGFFGRVYESVFMGSGLAGGGNTEDDENPYKNIVKLNLSALSTPAFEMQYERQLSKHLSVAIGGKFMPEKKVAFGEQLAGGSFGDSLTNQATSLSFNIGDFKQAMYSVTPELRFYFGKNMKGLYAAAYGRYQNRTMNFPVNYTDLSNQRNEYVFKGDISSIMGGIKIGAQANIKRFVLDVSFFGAHSFLSQTGGYSVDITKTLLPQEITDIDNSIKSAHEIISYVMDFDWKVEPNKISISPKPSIGFVGGSVSLGFRF